MQCVSSYDSYLILLFYRCQQVSGFLQPNNCKDSAKYHHSKALSLIFI